MFDTEAKLWLMCMGLIIMLVFPVVFWFYINIDSLSNQCERQGGIMVKTMDGWRCIDSKVLL